MSKKRLASLSLDLDNKWSYLKTHGDPAWKTLPSYLGKVVPRILEVLDELNLHITFFVVGQDAAIPSNQPILKSLVRSGHEIGNHSFHHEPWLHRYTTEQLTEEFRLAENAIESSTGIRPIGFRGPGFSLSDQVLQTMLNRGYEYDASTFPTFLGPLARAYYFMTAGFDRGQKEDRSELFGRWQDGFQTNRPFFWETGVDRLLEIPVTTMPIFKVPFHASYLFFLATYSVPLAKYYFWQAIQLCRLTRIQPSLLLHPLDFLGADDEPELAFFPGMRLAGQTKVDLMRYFLTVYCNHFQVVTMREHACAARAAGRLADRSIQWARAGAE